MAASTKSDKSFGNRKGSFFGKKAPPFSQEEVAGINYKNVRFLKRFVSERGKIIPSRITGVPTKQQRALARVIKRARSVGLMPYISD